MQASTINTNNTVNRFANVSVLSSQQSLQQQPVPSQQQTNVPLQQIPAQQYSTFQPSFVQPDIKQEQNEPAWFNNPKKRTIPQTIVKRSAFRTNPSHEQAQSSNSSLAANDKSGFSSVTFGSKKVSNIFNPSQQNVKNALNTNAILNDSNDAPPMVSIHDWKREDEFGSMPTLNNPSTFSSGLTSNLNTTINSDRINLKSTSSLPNSKPHLNIFDKDALNKHSTTENSEDTEYSNKSNSQINEYAIIVFGYPEAISNNIIKHFGNFGSILEDFEILRSASGINISNFKNKNSHNNNNNNNNNNDNNDGSATTKKYPIFTGEGWVKLTYDSQASAIRALQENGTIYSGSLLGCVPYSKSIVEQLASCKIEKNENIGENGLNVVNNNLTTSPLLNPTNENTTGNSSPIFNQLATTTSNAGITPPTTNLSFTNKLPIKDGKSLFIHDTNSTNNTFLQSLETKMRHQEEASHQQNGGVLHSINNWLFGWNNL